MEADEDEDEASCCVWLFGGKRRERPDTIDEERMWLKLRHRTRCTEFGPRVAHNLLEHDASLTRHYAGMTAAEVATDLHLAQAAR